jgi:peptidoglycan LD-endopeptidase LytH
VRRTFKGARLVILVVAVLAAGCASINPWREPPPPPMPLEELAIDEDITELYAMMRHDWAILSRRLSEIPPKPASVPAPAAPESTVRPATPTRLTADALLDSIVIPVVGVSRDELINSYGAPRDGGRRRHRGIDIMAPRGTRVVAVADGEISYVGTQSKAGRSVWLVTDAGVSFFYAHLDRWANGLREGQRVRKGDTIGYVGNTGNARRSSPHLHFAIHRDSEAINPYPHLVVAGMPERPRPVLAGGLTAGAQ